MIKRFEEIESWKKAREFTKEIYRVTGMGEFARDYGLRDQIRRAAVSIMSNIAEGFERNGNREFRQFLSLAKGSAGEVKSQLYVAIDAGFINQDQFTELFKEADNISRLLGGLIKYLQQSEIKGAKFK